jgi:zinc protease
MVAVGDISASETLRLAKQHFEPIPSHQTFGEPRTIEPKQDGARQVRIRKESELPLLMMAFHLPPSRSPENPAIQILEEILSTGESSRLYSRLVNKEEVALNAQVSDEPSLDPYLLTIQVQPRANVEVSRIEESVFDELREVSRTPVSDSELRKAKNQWLAARYREMKRIEGRANLLGTYEIFYGSYRRLYDEPADIERVSAADVQRVAATILAPENRTVGVLEPESKQKQAVNQ